MIKTMCKVRVPHLIFRLNEKKYHAPSKMEQGVISLLCNEKWKDLFQPQGVNSALLAKVWFSPPWSHLSAIWAKKLHQNALPAHGRTHFSPGSRIRLKNRSVLDSPETTLFLGLKRIFLIYSVVTQILVKSTPFEIFIFLWYTTSNVWFTVGLITVVLWSLKVERCRYSKIHWVTFRLLGFFSSLLCLLLKGHFFLVAKLK